VTHPEDIANVVKMVNKKQYHQAHTNPFGSGPLAQQLGRAGDTNQADQLLQGHLPHIP